MYTTSYEQQQHSSSSILHNTARVDRVDRQTEYTTADTQQRRIEGEDFTKN
jgi:hypothetical protein